MRVRPLACRIRAAGETPPLDFLALSWDPMARPKPALRVELLFYLTFLAAFAILVGVATSQLALSIAPERGVFLVVVLVAAEVGIFVLYGRSLVTRLVLRPLTRVMDTADAVADGDLAARAPDADTRDFATLAERLNRMTDRLSRSARVAKSRVSASGARAARSPSATASAVSITRVSGRSTSRVTSDRP